MSTKMILLILIVFFSGIFALPSTLSLFAGQHVWYDLSAEDNQIPCVKCHADIADELEADQESPHAELFNVDVNEACAACHRSDLTGYTYASGDGDAGQTVGEEVHAASTVACMVCHEYGHNVSHSYPWAGGFRNFSGSAYNYDGSQEGYGSKAAHDSFIRGAITESDLLEDSSEACIACHTTTNVTFNFNMTTGATIVVNDSYTDTHSYWNTTNITPSDYATYEEAKQIEWI